VFRVEATNIAVTQVVSQNIDDIRALRSRPRSGRKGLCGSVSGKATRYQHSYRYDAWNPASHAFLLVIFRGIYWQMPLSRLKFSWSGWK